MDKNALPLEFSCSCGGLQGNIESQAVKTGTHSVCYCADCRAGELYFDQPDPAPGPVDLFQTTPDALTITQGHENLGLMRLSPRGTMRWFAKCCNEPMFNTTPSRKLPFVGIKAETLKDPSRIGPVVGKTFMPRPGGKPTHKGMARLVWNIITRMGAAGLSGRWRNTPFFDESGKPVAQAVIPTKQERAALYPPQRRTKG